MPASTFSENKEIFRALGAGHSTAAGSAQPGMIAAHPDFKDRTGQDRTGDLIQLVR